MTDTPIPQEAEPVRPENPDAACEHCGKTDHTTHIPDDLRALWAAGHAIPAGKGSAYVLLIGAGDQMLSSSRGSAADKLRMLTTMLVDVLLDVDNVAGANLAVAMLEANLRHLTYVEAARIAGTN